jgi:hypothetical protein
MSDPKTKKTAASVPAFLKTIEDDQRRKDCRAVVKMMQEVTGEKPKMWGANMVGFGSYHYQYESGREGDWFVTGFSPRKTNLSLYLMAGFSNFEKLLAKLGKHKTGKACLYVNKLEDIDQTVLKKLIKESVAHVRRTWPAS